MLALENFLPSRYRSLQPLGSGGGGSVFKALDEPTGQAVAIKVLHQTHAVEEREALIDEAITLSSLEGLGMPPILAIGSLADGRLYVVRDLIEGESYAFLCEKQPQHALPMLPLVASAIVKIHEAGTLHGDIKPQNIIIEAQGAVKLVDFGLSQALGPQVTEATGYTPHYAAPETVQTGQLSPASEVYALGVILTDLLQSGAALGSTQAQQVQLTAIAKRATDVIAEQRFPSPGEFEHALRLSLGTDIPDEDGDELFIWKVREIKQWVYSFDEEVRRNEATGQRFVLSIRAPEGAGYSTLMRRYCWARALHGKEILLVDHPSVLLRVVDEVATSPVRKSSIKVFVFDCSLSQSEIHQLKTLFRLPCFSCAGIVALEALGSALCEVMADEVDSLLQKNWSLPALSSEAAFSLVERALRGFPEALWSELQMRIPLRPGPLRQFCLLAQELPIAAVADLDQILGTEPERQAEQRALLQVEFALERGRYALAAPLLGELSTSTDRELLAHARFELSTGSAERALNLCEKGLALAGPHCFSLQALAARAQMGLGDYQAALERLEDLQRFPSLELSEALAYRGLARSLVGEADSGRADLIQSLGLAQSLKHPRATALAAASLGTAQWREKSHKDAEKSYEIAMQASISAGEAGLLSSSLVNLAGLLKEQGHLFEAARMLQKGVTAARKSGRVASLRQALLNLANLDLYLGRVERVRHQLMRAKGLGALLPVQEAQWEGLHSELLMLDGQYAESLSSFRACAGKWEHLGRSREAAEALLEGAMMAASVPEASERDTSSFVPSTPVLQQLIKKAAGLLGEKKTPLYFLTVATCELLWQHYEAAESAAEQSLSQALTDDAREWSWRAYLILAEIADASNQQTRGTRCAQQGLEILEEIGARLSSEIAPIFWNDARRTRLKARATQDFAPPLRQNQTVTRASAGRAQAPIARESKRERQGETSSLGKEPEPARALVGMGTDLVSRLSRTPLEKRLSRILEINHDLAFEHDFERLSLRILGHASELLGAERALLLLGDKPETLKQVAVRGPGDRSNYPHSVAASVLQSGESFVSIDAAADPRLKGSDSVHSAALSAVICVAIASSQGSPQGVIYLETRRGVRADFATELPLLQAFSDQAAIALDRVKLVNALEQKTGALEEKSSALEAQTQVLNVAKEKLSELLGQRTASLQAAEDTIRRTKERLEAHTQFAGIVGGSPAMLRLFELIERVREREVPILITGESGTGKELVARAIHQDSPRKAKPMLAINCGAVPESILESELFGHRRGAFTGASRDRAGLFQQADGGVLFLDEVGETPIKMQASLLRVLQDNQVRAIGADAEITVDVRLIFATNRDLGQAVEEGRFREDLLYRIQVVQLHLPPLRERKEDIPLLIDHFLERYAIRFDQPKKQLTQEARQYLMHHSLPGNVRQLENLLLSAWVLSEGQQIEAQDLGSDVELASIREARSRRDSDSRRQGLPAAKKEAEELSQPQGSLTSHQRDEKTAILDALKKADYNRVRAAALLEMPRRTFYRRLKKYEIQ